MHIYVYYDHVLYILSEMGSEGRAKDIKYFRFRPLTYTYFFVINNIFFSFEVRFKEQYLFQDFHQKETHTKLKK